MIGVRKRNKKKRNYETFNLYIYKILKSIASDVNISKKGINVINSLITDMFDQLALESSKLCRYSNKKTLSSQDIKTSVKLLLPLEIGSHAIAEANKSLIKFHESG